MFLTIQPHTTSPKITAAANGTLPDLIHLTIAEPVAGSCSEALTRVVLTRGEWQAAVDELAALGVVGVVPGIPAAV